VQAVRPGVKPRIQPVTIDYADPQHGRAITDEQRDRYAWHGDMTLMPHLWRLLGRSGMIARVRLHDVLQPTAGVDRKALAATAERVVAEGLIELRAA
jgi:1-acyl-sn-glycerol-3-phosphate acyltransferase